MEEVTVVTLTRRRPELLHRAMASVREQDYTGEIKHAIIVDDCAETMAALESPSMSQKRHVTVHFEPRPQLMAPHSPSFGGAYSRVAFLLNEGVRRATSPWIALLDDDNEYEPDHLSSLMERAVTTGAEAVHSGRQILRHDGSPYLVPIFPWARERELGRRIHQMLCSRGVWVANTNVLLDRGGPPGPGRMVNSTVAGVNDPVMLVDTSVWLLKRDLLVHCPIPEDFNRQDDEEGTCPDDKLLAALLARRTRIVMTGRPTLRYYLGGMSNAGPLA